MTRSEESAKRIRWRPRFSLRTLAKVFTLLAAYFAAWEATKKRGIEDVDAHIRSQKRSYSFESVASPLPCVVRFDLRKLSRWEDNAYVLIAANTITSEYYVWLFGSVYKLPFESESEPQ